MKTISPICVVLFCIAFIMVNVIMPVSITYWAILAISFTSIVYFCGEVSPTNIAIMSYSKFFSSIIRIGLAATAIHFGMEVHNIQKAFFFFTLAIAWVIISSFLLKKLSSNLDA
jgi:hypothetical protein